MPLIVATVIICLLTVLSFFGEYSQFCEILSHFVLFYCVAILLLMPASVLWKNRLAFLICFLTLVLNLFRLGPLFDVRDRVQPGLNSQNLSLIAFNCENHHNRKPEEIFKIVKVERPDFLCLSEIDSEWARLIEKNWPQYAYKSVYPSYPGMAFLSKLPFEKSQVLLSDGGKKARIVSIVRMSDGRPLMVMTVHPGIPLNGKAFVSRNNDFQTYAREVQSFGGPKIIAGDLNCTPWSYYFQKLLKDARLVDSEYGFGPQASWSLWGLLPPLLPIDHCLVSEDIVVTDRKIEGDAGSDHRPVIVRFSIPTKSEGH